MSDFVLTRAASGFLASLAAANGFDSALHTEVERQLSYRRRRRSTHAEFRTTNQRYMFDKFALYKFASDVKSVVFPAGLTHRVCNIVRAAGGGVSFTDLRTPRLPAPRLDLLDGSALKQRPDQCDALAVIFASDMGVVSSPTAWGKTFLLEQLVAAYPASRILIASYRSDVCRSIFDRVRRKCTAGAISLCCGGRGSPARVNVCTIDSIHRADPQNADLFLYDEVHEAASPTRMRGIALVTHGRRFGFSATAHDRSDGANLPIEAMFGPVIYAKSYQAAQAAGSVAKIDVEMHTIGGAPIVYSNEVMADRFGLWRNGIRNAKLAELATYHVTTGAQVLIAVSKLEHALVLKLMLPSWQLIHGSTDEEQIAEFEATQLLPNGRGVLCKQDDRDRLRKDFENGKLRCAISTTVWSQGVDFRHLDVLIRGDGMPGVIAGIQWAGRLARGSAGLLVDFWDTFDPRFLKRSETRARHYRAKGWTVTRR